MAHPRKYSRLITVAGQVYRWRMALDDDCPESKSIAVYGEGISHGAELRFEVELPSVTPGLIRRVVLAGLALGFDPSVQSTSRHLSPEQVSEAAHVYPRCLTCGDRKFVWTPDFKGGLHMKIRSATSAKGQLLATMSTLRLDQLTDHLASLFIQAAQKAGWQPEHKGLDCFWLENRECEEIASHTMSTSENQAASGS